MKTRADVIEQAFRRLGLKAADEALTADMAAYGGDMLDALHAELVEHAPMPWWPTQIPDQVFIPLANLLATEIGPAYMVAVEPRARSMIRLMAVLRPDDRKDATAEARYY